MTRGLSTKVIEDSAWMKYAIMTEAGVEAEEGGVGAVVGAVAGDRMTTVVETGLVTGDGVIEAEGVVEEEMVG